MSLRDDQTLFPQLLRDAGYWTVHDGKNHYNNSAKLKPAFDVITAPRWDDPQDPGAERQWVRLLQERPRDRPFFFWLNPIDAHLKWMKDPEGRPHEPREVVVPPFLVDDKLTRRDFARFYDEIQRMDRFIGELVRELSEQSVLDDTLILFLADNGRPFARCKTRLYDSGVKTPMLVHWPRHMGTSPRVTATLVSAVDVAPTILDVAGLLIPKSVQGVSFAPVLSNSKTSGRELAFAEHNWHGFQASERMVRWGDWLYIHNDLPEQDVPPVVEAIRMKLGHITSLRAGHAAGTLTPAQQDWFLQPRPAEELYAVAADPHQLKNLASDPAAADALAFGRNALACWRGETGDTCAGAERISADQNSRQTGEVLERKFRRGEIAGSARRAETINASGPVLIGDVK